MRDDNIYGQFQMPAPVADHEFEALRRAEDEGLLHALKMSAPGQRLLELWKADVAGLVRRLKTADPSDPLRVKELQSIIFIHEQWIAGLESAEPLDPDTLIDRDTDHEETH